MSNELESLQRPEPPELTQGQAFTTEPVLDESGNVIGWLSHIVELHTPTKDVTTEYDS